MNKEQAASFTVTNLKIPTEQLKIISLSSAHATWLSTEHRTSDSSPWVSVQ